MRTPSVVKPYRTAAELHAEHLQKPVVHCVEPQMIHLEERERLGGHILGDGAVAAHLGPVAHALQQAVGQTRRAPGAPGNFKRALLVDRTRSGWKPSGTR